MSVTASGPSRDPSPSNTATLHPGASSTRHRGGGGNGEEKDGDRLARARRGMRDYLHPPDSYTPQGTYWADLPPSDRRSFVSRQYAAETRRELQTVSRMFRRNPLSPLGAYWSTFVVAGLGLFVEGYTLFSVGNLKPLFQAVWPECWRRHTVCNKQVVNMVDYLEIVGIIIGQIVVGVEGDWIGRRFGMVQDALVMTLGSVMLTVMWGASLQGWVICYAISLFIYGFGVGGEYPMTATSSGEAESVGRLASSQDRLHRGRRVSLAFLMQGWGQLVNQALLLVLLLIFNRTLDPPYSKKAAQWTFRLSFAFIAIFTLYLTYLRYYRIRYADSTLRAAKKRLNTSGYDLKSLKLAGGHYWHRMIGTAGTWFSNDVAFYGNKIFAGVFIELITGGSPSVGTVWLYNGLNVLVSLTGYYGAALLIVLRLIGPVRLQTFGFLFMFVLFLICAIAFETLIGSSSGLKAFQAIYFLSSWSNQIGPNTTTFLTAAISYPASIRATAHGFSAAAGKLGALLPAVVYSTSLSDRNKFWFVTFFSLSGLACNLLFLPDVTGLELREQERYWQFVTEGREREYHGRAIHPRHLSWFETAILKRHALYDPVKDEEQKIEELRRAYESAKREGGKEEVEAEAERSDEMRIIDEYELQPYFEDEKGSDAGRAPSLTLNEGNGEKNPDPTGPETSKLAEVEANFK